MPRLVGQTTSELKTVIDAMTEAVVLTDDHDRVTALNASAERLFPGRPPTDREDLLARFEPLPIGLATPSEDGVMLRPRSQPNRWFEVRAVPLGRHEPPDAGPADGGPLGGSVYVLSDVTEARSSRAEREAFLSVVSHELRTPITTIYAGSSVLARGGALTPAASHHLAADISAEAARLYDLVEDLLVVVRSERKVLEPMREPVLLQRVVESTIRLAARRSPDVPVIQAGQADPPPIDGDATYVEQAARNLILAATRFGGPGAPVVVRLDVDDDRGEIALRVLDRGPSLSDDEAARAFELAEDGPSQHRPGAGLAAFVTRRLIETMGGRVWATGRTGGGAEFGFALPRYAA